MPKIQCLKGYAETPIGNYTYVFSKRDDGKYVATVLDLKHVAILTGLVDVYKLLDEENEPTAMQTTVVVNSGGVGDETPEDPIGLGDDAPQDQIVDGAATLVKGIGPATAGKLMEFGVNTLQDIIALNDTQIATLDTKLELNDSFVKFNWQQKAQEQLDIIAAGDSE